MLFLHKKRYKKHRYKYMYFISFIYDTYDFSFVLQWKIGYKNKIFLLYILSNSYDNSVFDKFFVLKIILDKNKAIN